MSGHGIPAPFRKLPSRRSSIAVQGRQLLITVALIVGVLLLRSACLSVCLSATYFGVENEKANVGGHIVHLPCARS